jgi:hypothetical protein
MLFHSSTCEHGCRYAQLNFVSAAAVMVVALASFVTLSSFESISVVMLGKWITGIAAVIALFLFLLFRPSFWFSGEKVERCFSCASTFVDVWYRPTSPPVYFSTSVWVHKVAPAMRVAHCRRCGNESEEKSFYGGVVN